MSLIQNKIFRFIFLLIIIIFLIHLKFPGSKLQVSDYFKQNQSYPKQVHTYSKQNQTYSKQNQSSCEMSMMESDQLICEPDEKWHERRKLYSKQHEKNILTMNEYEKYFYENWFPEFQCPHEVRLGQGDGGKWACDIEYLKSKPSCLVYSMGSNRDFTFEEAVHKQLPRCSIHTVDMQPATCPPGVCTFHLVQLGDGKGKTKTLRQFMSELNHTNSHIDILKIDIEFGEHVFFHILFSNNALNRNLPPLYIRQILMEVHLDRAKIFETNSLFHLFKSQNYAIYHKELNPGFPFYACEYGFVKLNKTFFRGHI